MSDTGRPGADPNQPGGLPTWGRTGATPPTSPPPATSWQAAQSQPPAGWSAAASPASSSPATGDTPPTPAPVAVTPAAVPPATGGEPPADEPKNRPGWLVPAIIAVVVLVVAAVIVGIVRSGAGDDAAVPPPAAASTVLLPSPTPTVAPVARTATTAFATALPATVLQYALATSAENPAWVAAGAVEAYTETYTDGGAGTATVNAGQWETPAEAAAYAATLVAALPPAPAADPTATAAPGAPTLPQSGDVSAGGAAVGTYTIADLGNGTGSAVWTNGTTVFQVTAPVADIVDFYSAYPL